MRLLLWAAILLLIPFARTHACQCLGPEHEQSIRRAKIIFAVHVDSAEPDSLSRFRQRYRVHVLAVWRGTLPQLTTVVAFNSAACGYPLEVGGEYLIYILRDTPAKELESAACTGTAPLEDLYYDRYLLGEPMIRHSEAYETVTLDTILDRIRRPAVEAVGLQFQFRHFKAEAQQLLPQLRRLARQDLPGNQLAAVQAIDMLGTAAADAYDDLCFIHDHWGRKDATLRAAVLSAMFSVKPDYPSNMAYVLRAIHDPDPDVRLRGLWSTHKFSNMSEAEARKIRWRFFDDEDPKLRAAAIHACRFEDFSSRTAKRIKQMSREDPAATVRERARDYLELRERYAHYSRPFRSVDDRGFEHPRNRR